MRAGRGKPLRINAGRFVPDGFVGFDFTDAALMEERSAGERFSRPELTAEITPRKNFNSIFGLLASVAAIDDEAACVWVFPMESSKRLCIFG